MIILFTTLDVIVIKPLHIIFHKITRYTEVVDENNYLRLTDDGKKLNISWKSMKKYAIESYILLSYSKEVLYKKE